MNKFLVILFSLFLTASTYSQYVIIDNSEIQSSEVVKTPWTKGNFFVGVNSDVLGLSLWSVSLSPFIGYAITNNDMIYGSLYYTEDPRISTFKLGWNKRVYHSAYIGLAGSIYGEKATWQKAVSVEIGVCKNLWSWLMISPKISFTDSWSETNADFNFTTSVSFAVKI